MAIVEARTVVGFKNRFHLVIVFHASGVWLVGNAPEGSENRLTLSDWP